MVRLGWSQGPYSLIARELDSPPGVYLARDPTNNVSFYLLQDMGPGQVAVQINFVSTLGRNFPGIHRVEPDH